MPGRSYDDLEVVDRIPEPDPWAKMSGFKKRTASNSEKTLTGTWLDRGGKKEEEKIVLQ